jgi:UDP-N-acetylglucosamine--N-acetylmuramyl-(pentapeptide) pyrophosphoryl-undecaprenol N-acetylglucosamine transferase
MTAAPATATWDRAALSLAASAPTHPATPQTTGPAGVVHGAFSGTVLLATGGTGGHVFPAEALAGALAASGASLALLTDARGRQWKGALASHPIHHLRAASPSGGMVQRLLGIANLALGFLQALPIIRRIRPAVVVGFGGYASVPTVLAARVLGVPSVVHEQNAVLGRANRLCAGGAAAIATAFATVRHLAPGDARVRLVGNPVRDAVRRLRELSYRAPASDETLQLVVIGGSQGAASFSEVIPQAVLALPPELRARLSIVQQCRAEDLERVRETYRSAGIAAELATFFPDFPARLAGAHLVVARSGASTVAELSTSGRPSILVPFPHATEDHQRANAAALDEVGACILLPQERFTAAALASHMRALLAEPARLAQMADAAREAGHPDAAEHLAELVIAVARGRKDTR